MQKILIAYIPVLHKGYLDLIDSEKPDCVSIMDEKVVADLGIDYIIRKDSLRAIPSQYVMSAFKDWVVAQYINIFELRFLDKDFIHTFKKYDIVMPDEDISRDFVKKYFSDIKVSFKSCFLRWHRDNMVDQKMAENYNSISISDFESKMMELAIFESERSADWWRQIGAVLVKDNNVLFTAHNKHLPDEQAPNYFGDPRAIFKRGIHVDLSTSEHAEASIIAEAANKGVSLNGAYLFTTDFPCPPCAKLIAHSGIKKLFFKNGYAMLDGIDVLEKAGVEIFRVK